MIKTKLINLRFLKDQDLVILICIGLFIRLLAALIPGMMVDTPGWFAWAVRLNQLPFAQFYSDQVWTNYTPGFLYVLAFLGWLKDIFHFDTVTFYYILKLPAILADLILAAVIYRVCLDRLSKKISLLASATVLFNPVTVFNGAVWGQIESVLTLPLFLSIYFLVEKKIIYSSVFIAAAFLIKPQAIALIPVFALFLFKNLSLKSIIKLSLPALVIALFLSWPFFTKDPLLGLFKMLAKMTQDYPITSLNAYNFWGVIGLWVNDGQKWIILSYQNWGYLLLGIYWLIVVYWYFKKKLSFYSLATLALLSFFFLPTRVHERYLYPVIVFLGFLTFYLKDKLMFCLFLILSILHLTNLYYVYVYYNEIYLKMPKMLYLPGFYEQIAKNSFLLSLSSTILFLIISVMIIKNKNDA
ncbi:DUF2029 domain-containing protein [Candidatus Daviesbacteria bacterium]|nr:DUF2029 domain-containing protein [Candidatus Daviesbacteria bacterium]